MMGLPAKGSRNTLHHVLLALFGNRLTVFGVAAVVMACAVLGVAIPQTMPDQQPDRSEASAASASVKRVPRDNLSPLLGKEVRSASGADIGQVAGVLVDSATEPRAVIIRVGGFLGVGVRTVAVDWQTLRLPAAGDGDVVLADLAPHQLARAPQYQPDARSIAVLTVTASGADERNLGYGQ